MYSISKKTNSSYMFQVSIHIPCLSEKKQRNNRRFKLLSDVSVLRRKGKFTALWLLSGGSESPSIDEKFGLVFGARKNYNKFIHKFKNQIHAKKNTRMTHMILTV